MLCESFDLDEVENDELPLFVLVEDRDVGGIPIGPGGFPGMKLFTDPVGSVEEVDRCRVGVTFALRSLTLSTTPFPTMALERLDDEDV